MVANTQSLHYDLPPSNLVIKPMDHSPNTRSPPSTITASSPSKKQKRIIIIQPKGLPREEDCRPKVTKCGLADKCPRGIKEKKIVNRMEGTSSPPPCDNTKEEKSTVAAKPWSLRTNRKQVIPWAEPEPRARMKKGMMNNDEILKRPRFSVALTKKEIEEDFIAMTNQPPPKRPKKHPRPAQQHVDVSDQFRLIKILYIIK